MHTFTSFATILGCLIVNASAFFKDVSIEVGLDYSGGPLPKYGGGAVADLDADGCPDLIFGHHTDRMELYFNRCDGTFEKSGLGDKLDLHAILPLRLTSGDRTMHFVLCRGGSNGNNKQGPRIFKVFENRTILEVTHQHRTNDLGFRGRAALAVDLLSASRPRWMRGSRQTDLLLTSADLNGTDDSVVAFRSSSKGILKRRVLNGDINEFNVKFVAPIDANNDGIMDVLSLPEVSVFTVTDDFTLTQATNTVFPYLPDGLLWHGVAAMAEADFNNDGLMDLYLGRTKTGDLKWRAANASYNNVTDVLLFGTPEGRYRYADSGSGIPDDTETRGVTVGDFNNDGWIDILLILWTGKDVLLINKRDGTFRSQVAAWSKLAGANGDTATAVDYDRDGRLDVVLSEGSYNRDGAGFYRIMKNILPLSKTSGKPGWRNFLLVRVGASPTRRSTSLHAIVTVGAGSLRMVRRVGPAGVCVSVSYIETVHFGLAAQRVAQFVQVKWTDGSRSVQHDIAANSIIEFGVF